MLLDCRIEVPVRPAGDCIREELLYETSCAHFGPDVFTSIGFTHFVSLLGITPNYFQSVASGGFLLLQPSATQVHLSVLPNPLL